MVVSAPEFRERTDLLRQAFDDLRAGADEFESRALDELGGIDRIRQEVLIRAQSLFDDRRAFEDERARREIDYEENSIERVELQQQLASLHEQSQRLSSAVLELSTARAQLLERLRAAEHVAADHETRTAEQLHARDDERQALEIELEAVRRRAAELAETLNREKREVSDERAGWMGEVRRFRQSFDEQAAILGELRDLLRKGGGAEFQLRATCDRSEPVAGDVVLDSVMNQFEELQREFSQRRQAPAMPKRA